MVEEVVEDPTFGPIAPRAENREEPKKKTVMEQLLEDLDRDFPDDPIDQIHATTGNRKHEHNRRSRRRKLATRTS